MIVKVNEPLAIAYIEKLDELEQKFQISSNHKLDLVARFADIITVERAESEEDVLWTALLPALEQALLKFVEMREKDVRNSKTKMSYRCHGL